MIGGEAFMTGIERCRVCGSFHQPACDPPRAKSAEIMAAFDALPQSVRFAVAFADFPWEPWQLREALGSEDEPLSAAVVARLDRDGHKRLDYLRRNRLGPYAVGRSALLAKK